MRTVAAFLIAASLASALPVAAEEKVYDISDPALTQKPKLSREKFSVPAYPPGAHKRGEQGTVAVSLCVSAKGKAENAEVTRSAGSADLDGAVLKWVKGAKFEPAIAGGQPVAVCGHTVEWEWKNATVSKYPEISRKVADTEPVRTGGPDRPETPDLINDPRLARYDQSGRVKLSVCVGPSGNVEQIVREKVTGNPVLDQLTANWAFGLTYTPAMKDGAPVGVCGVAIEYDWPKR